MADESPHHLHASRYEEDAKEPPSDPNDPDVELDGTTILTDGNRLFKRIHGNVSRYRDYPNINPIIRRADRVKAYQLRSHPAINNGLLVQSRGRLMPEPCGPCAAGKGPFAECRGGFDDINSGACGGCIWAHTGSFCSYYHGQRRGPRNKDSQEAGTPIHGPSTIDILAGTVPQENGYYRNGTPDSLAGDAPRSQNGTKKRRRESDVHPQLQQVLETAAQLQAQAPPVPAHHSRHTQQPPPPPPPPHQAPPAPSQQHTPMWRYPPPPPNPYAHPEPLPQHAPVHHPPHQPAPPQPPQPQAHIPSLQYPIPPPAPKVFNGTFFIHPRPVNEAMGAIPRDAALCRAPQSFFNVVQTLRAQIGDGPILKGVATEPFAVTLTWPDAPRKIMIPWGDSETFKLAMAFVNTLDLPAVDVYCTYKNSAKPEKPKSKENGSGDTPRLSQQPSNPSQVSRKSSSESISRVGVTANGLS